MSQVFFRNFFVRNPSTSQISPWLANDLTNAAARRMVLSNDSQDSGPRCRYTVLLETLNYMANPAEAFPEHLILCSTKYRTNNFFFDVVVAGLPGFLQRG
jgi:hypothetical protein